MRYNDKNKNWEKEYIIFKVHPTIPGLPEPLRVKQFGLVFFFLLCDILDYRRRHHHDLTKRGKI